MRLFVAVLGNTETANLWELTPFRAVDNISYRIYNEPVAWLCPVGKRTDPVPGRLGRAAGEGSGKERLTSALAPALSPKRGGIVRRAFEILSDGIGRTLIRKTRNKRMRFPLLGRG